MWFQISGVAITAAEAIFLLNPDDSMDVAHMVKFLQTVTANGKEIFDSLPEVLIKRRGAWGTLREIQLHDEVTVSLVAMIVNYKGGLNEEGDHTSVTEYLCNAYLSLHFWCFFASEGTVLTSFQCSITGTARTH